MPLVMPRNIPARARRLRGVYLNFPERSEYRATADKALKMCTPVSKRWVGRSRIHLFEGFNLKFGPQVSPRPPTTPLPIRSDARVTSGIELGLRIFSVLEVSNNIP